MTEPAVTAAHPNPTMNSVSDVDPSWHDYTFPAPDPRFISSGKMDAIVRYQDESEVKARDYVRAWTTDGTKFARLQIRDIHTVALREAPRLLKEHDRRHHSTPIESLRDHVGQRCGDTPGLTDDVRVLFIERHELFGPRG